MVVEISGERDWIDIKVNCELEVFRMLQRETTLPVTLEKRVTCNTVFPLAIVQVDDFHGNPELRCAINVFDLDGKRVVSTDGVFTHYVWYDLHLKIVTGSVQGFLDAVRSAIRMFKPEWFKYPTSPDLTRSEAPQKED